MQTRPALQSPSELHSGSAEGVGADGPPGGLAAGSWATVPLAAQPARQAKLTAMMVRARQTKRLSTGLGNNATLGTTLRALCCSVLMHSSTQWALSVGCVLVGCASAPPSNEISHDEPIVEPEPAIAAAPAARAAASALEPLAPRDARDCSVEFQERLESGGTMPRIEAIPCLKKESDSACSKRAEAQAQAVPGGKVVAVKTDIRPTNFEVLVSIDGVVEDWVATAPEEVAARATALAKEGRAVKLLTTKPSKSGQRQALVLLSVMKPLAPSTKTQARIQWKPKEKSAETIAAFQALAKQLGVTVTAHSWLEGDRLDITLECGG